MFQVETQDGPRYMVTLVGPRSYTPHGGKPISRGQTITVTKSTRDYLVKRTKYFADYSPEIAEDIEEALPPQFGQDAPELFNPSDFDFGKNPPLSMDQAAMLAERGNHVNQNGEKIDADDDEAQGINPAALQGPSERGDMTGTDLKAGQKNKQGGSQTAAAPAKPKPSNLKVKGAPDESGKKVAAAQIT